MNLLMIQNYIYWFIALILVIVGIFGSVFPALPGAPLIFLGLLFAAWIDNFDKVGVVALLVLGTLTLFILFIDIIATGRGAKKVGASKGAIYGATLGTFLGIFFGIIGFIFGPFIGAFIGEILTTRDALKAGKVGFGTWLGLAIGTAVKVALGFVMIIVFFLFYIFG